MTDILVPIPEPRRIAPLGPVGRATFVSNSWEVRKDMLALGKLLPIPEVLPPVRMEQVAFARNELDRLLWWEWDDSFCCIFMNPKELIEEAVRLNEATQAMIRGHANDLTPWLILASPRISQVMDSDTSLAQKFLQELEPGPVGMGRGLRASEDFAADASAAYQIIMAFRGALARSVYHRPKSGNPIKRYVDLGDITPLLSLYVRIKGASLEWLCQSIVRDAYNQLWNFLDARVNREFISMSPESRKRLEVLAEGGVL